MRQTLQSKIIIKFIKNPKIKLHIKTIISEIFGHEKKSINSAILGMTHRKLLMKTGNGYLCLNGEYSDNYYDECIESIKKVLKNSAMVVKKIAQKTDINRIHLIAILSSNDIFFRKEIWNYTLFTTNKKNFNKKGRTKNIRIEKVKNTSHPLGITSACPFISPRLFERIGVYFN
jgi:hypothetical protein